MAKNKITDLRDHLFQALEALADAENPMDIERAKAISEVAQTIINSAKVEVEILKVAGGFRPVMPFFNLEEDRNSLAVRPQGSGK